MDESTAIKINNLSKQYRLGLVGTGTFSHDLKRWWNINILKNEDPYLKIGEENIRSEKGTSNYVWALRDINLTVNQGDVIGVIGKNGAGKSTLLKILSRVTKPTMGSIKYKGRMASLLEVGTGFHPELTGRENIFMNGSIMGMTRKEISGKLDEIVSFAGIERYVDTPVKRYSSGMTVRLGFSVAAHLEPDILIVDEVLAVGDAEFQKKAIGKMKDVSQSGQRTVLFVSHNMSAIQNLCKTAILIENGQIKHNSNVNDVISKYIIERKQEKVIDLTNISRKGESNLHFKYSKITITNQLNQHEIVEGDSLIFDIEFQVKTPLQKVAFGISIQDNLGNNIIECRSFKHLEDLNITQTGLQKIRATLKPNLKAGMYNVSIGAISTIGSLDYISSAYTLVIQTRTNDNDPWYKDNVGLLITDHHWQIEK